MAVYDRSFTADWNLELRASLQQRYFFFENIFFLNEENPMPIVPGKNGTQFELVVVLRGLFRHCRGLRIGFRRQQRRLVPEKPSKTRYMPINIEETC